MKSILLGSSITYIISGLIALFLVTIYVRRQLSFIRCPECGNKKFFFIKDSAKPSCANCGWKEAFSAWEGNPENIRLKKRYKIIKRRT